MNTRLNYNQRYGDCEYRTLEKRGKYLTLSMNTHDSFDFARRTPLSQKK